jgi:hypothetical protein
MRIAPLVLAFALVLDAAAAEVQKLPAFSGQGASPVLVKALEQEGAGIVLPDGLACELWVRAALPSAAAKNEAQGALYPSLWPSAFVGLVRFPKPFTDFRGQTIQPGSYTLRYELLPEDGNHLGVAPDRDFLLLVPVAADADPNAQIASPQLLELSKKASGTNHPAVMSLVQPEPGAGSPTLSQSPEGHWVVSLPLKTSDTALRLALVVKGVGTQ